MAPTDHSTSAILPAFLGAPSASKPPNDEPFPLGIHACSSSHKLLEQQRFEELSRVYKHQIDVGCQTPSCTAKFCQSNPAFAAKVRVLAEEGKATLCRKLAMDGLKQNPHYELCPGLGIPTEILHLDVLNSNVLRRRRRSRDLFLETVRHGISSPTALVYSFLPAGTSFANARSSCDLDVEEVGQLWAWIDEARGCDVLVDALAILTQQLLEGSRRRELSSGCVSASLSASPNDSNECFSLAMCRPLLIGLHILRHCVGRAGIEGTVEGCSSVVPVSELLNNWLQAFARLDATARQSMHTHWERLPASVLTDLVSRVLHPTITQFVKSSASLYTTPALAHACMLLQSIARSLGDVPRVWEGSTHHYVDCSLFYNKALNAKIDVWEDYTRWYGNEVDAGRDKGRNPRREECGEMEGFSFISCPCVLETNTKAKILRAHARRQQTVVSTAAWLTTLTIGSDPTLGDKYCILRVDRAALVESALREVSTKRADLKKPLAVEFIGEYGVDAGGVTREFFSVLVKRLFDADHGMFTYDSAACLHWFAAPPFKSPEQYHLVGVVCGLAIYNDVSLDVRFPPLIYKRLMGKGVNHFDELKFVDEDLHNGLVKLMAFEEDAESGITVEEMHDRNFTIERDHNGVMTTVELKAGGAGIALTKENREEYTQLYSKYIVEDSVNKPFNAFAEGFNEMCGGPILRVFEPEELELLISGGREMDFDALEAGCVYEGYRPEEQTVRDFWKVVHGLDADARRKFLRFCSGTDRVPIGGLKALGLRIGRNGGDSELLPTAHTCFKYLLLPAYTSVSKMEIKMNQALENCEGFGLS